MVSVQQDAYSVNKYSRRLPFGRLFAGNGHALLCLLKAELSWLGARNPCTCAVNSQLLTVPDGEPADTGDQLMEDRVEVKNHFFIDIAMERVFCRSCRKICRSLTLTTCTLFWCDNRACSNSDDVRLLPDGTWNIFTFVEHWQENSVSQIEAELLISIRSSEDA